MRIRRGNRRTQTEKPYPSVSLSEHGPPHWETGDETPELVHDPPKSEKPFPPLKICRKGGYERSKQVARLMSQKQYGLAKFPIEFQ
jgi:hypothetical protein